MMKRPIAMLLALLLTASLFAFSGCGDGKNYTVEVVDGHKRIFLNENEIDRIWDELQQVGYSVTRLSGLSIDELDPITELPLYNWENGTGNAEDVFSYADIIISCNQIGNSEIYRIDAKQSSSYATFYADVYTLKINKVFYGEDAVKKGDTIRVAFYRWRVGETYRDLDQLKNSAAMTKGVLLKQQTDWDAPMKNKTMYMTLSCYPVYEANYETYRFTAIADYISCYGIPYILKVDKDGYMIHEIYSDLVKDALKIPEEERNSSLNLYIETSEFEERFQKMVDDYDHIKRLSKQ